MIALCFVLFDAAMMMLWCSIIPNLLTYYCNSTVVTLPSSACKHAECRSTINGSMGDAINTSITNETPSYLCIIICKMTVLIKCLLFIVIHGPALVYSFTSMSSCISNGRFSSNDHLPLQSHSHALHTNSILHSKVKACSLQMATNPDNEEYTRRRYIRRVLLFGGVACTTSTMTIPLVSHAAGSEPPTNESMPRLFKKGKNRNDGYSVQHSVNEWTTLLSGTQYNVLRKGGTERQRGSILEKEKRPGTYVCAGCNSPLFASTSKFNSGTGWPSFESTIATDAVEIEELDLIHSLDGAEVRCRTCGGHLGDVFGDGRRYGSKTGKRYCINGAALIFISVEGARDLRGDVPPPNKVIEYEPALRR